jgi:hypothetical protein
MQVRKSAVATTVAALVCVCLLPARVAAADADFSGSYTLTMKKHTNNSEKDVPTMRVVEDSTFIEVTRTVAGHQLSNVYPLTGSPGRFVSEGGQVGTCRASFKGNELILESFVNVSPQRGLPAMQVHTREKWELSRDMKTIKIRTNVEFPGSPLGAFSPVDPWTDVYARN